jgi:hypothetical protein
MKGAVVAQSLSGNFPRFWAYVNRDFDTLNNINYLNLLWVRFPPRSDRPIMERRILFFTKPVLLSRRENQRRKLRDPKLYTVHWRQSKEAVPHLLMKRIRLVWACLFLAIRSFSLILVRLERIRHEKKTKRYKFLVSFSLLEDKLAYETLLSVPLCVCPNTNLRVYIRQV